MRTTDLIISILNNDILSLIKASINHWTWYWASNGAVKSNNKFLKRRKNPEIEIRIRNECNRIFFLISLEISELIKRLSPKKANAGIANCAIINIIDTVLNLLYSGKWSKKKFEMNGKYLPQESIKEKIIREQKTHLMGFFTTNSDIKNSNQTTAPI